MLCVVCCVLLVQCGLMVGVVRYALSFFFLFYVCCLLVVCLFFVVRYSCNAARCVRFVCWVLLAACRSLCADAFLFTRCVVFGVLAFVVCCVCVVCFLLPVVCCALRVVRCVLCVGC